MRYGVIADVHGNLPALEAVVDRLEGEEVDAYLCAGDLVGYGPFPNECVALVASLRGVTCVAGNHDLIALGRLGDDRCIRLARETLAWTAGVLDDHARTYLAGLPLDARAFGGVAVTHGAPGDPQEYVRTAERARELLDGGVLVAGHTHEPWVFGARSGDAVRGDERGMLFGRGEAWLLNPGSVGQSRSRDPRARFAVLDVERDAISLHALEYDAEATRRALRERGLPENACHLPPRSPVRRALGRAARTVLRR